MTESLSGLLAEDHVSDIVRKELSEYEARKQVSRERIAQCTAELNAVRSEGEKAVAPPTVRGEPSAQDVTVMGEMLVLLQSISHRLERTEFENQRLRTEVDVLRNAAKRGVTDRKDSASALDAIQSPLLTSSGSTPVATSASTGRVCDGCFNGCETIYLCPWCQLESYCSPECQLLRFDVHRELCVAQQRKRGA
jgi:hypothetical protein